MQDAYITTKCYTQYLSCNTCTFPKWYFIIKAIQFKVKKKCLSYHWNISALSDTYYIIKAQYWILNKQKKIKPRNHSHILAVTSVYTFTKIFNYNIHITAFFPQIDGSLNRTFWQMDHLFFQNIMHIDYKFPNIAFPM